MVNSHQLKIQIYREVGPVNKNTHNINKLALDGGGKVPQRHRGFPSS